MEAGRAAPIPSLSTHTSWERLFRGRSRAALEDVLPGFLRTRRWFGGKARRIKGAEVRDAVRVPVGRAASFIVLVRVSYTEGDPDTYVLTLGFATGERAGRLLEHERHRVLAHMRLKEGEGVLHEAFADRGFGLALLEAIGKRRVFRGLRGDVVATPGRAFKRLRGPLSDALEPSPLGAEQSNTSLLFGDRLILKLFRRVDVGENPDLELGRFLTERAGFRHVPAVAGALEYRPRRGAAMSIAILQQCVPNQGDAWQFTLDAVDLYFERIQVLSPGRRPPPSPPSGSLLDRARSEIPTEARELIGTYLGEARLLGRRTAELHRALAGDRDDPAFAPEPFTPLDQRALYESMRSLTARGFALLRRRRDALPESAREEAAHLARRRGEVLERFGVILDRKLTARRTRVHGDYHLGQVLRSEGDFVIIDFEGEPAAPLGTRRMKQCPLRDTAAMIRSLHYAAHHGLEARGRLRPEERATLEPWAQHWYLWTAAAFLRGYLDAAADAEFLPRDDQELESLLTVYLLEKAVYELGYELNTRPEWVYLPILGIRQLLEAGG